MKRIGIIYIAAILAVGMLIPSAFAAAGIPSDLTAVPASFDHNIDYERALDEDYKLTTTKNPQIYIDMAQERLFVEAGALAEGKSIVAISYNGGVKWTRIGGIPDSGLDISKALNKGGMFRVTTSLDAKGKGIVTEGDDKSDVYEFPSIDKRPKVERWMVNFSKYADASGATTGQWALTVKNSNDALNLTYQIASSASKKTPDRVYFQNGALYEGTNPETVTGLVPADWGYFKVGEGINIKPMTGTKVTKTTYLIRTAPTKTTPASKVKKVNISGQGKTVKFKADYKKEYIKLKDNARLFAGNLTELVENDTASTVVSYDKESAKTGYVLDDKKTADKYGQTLSIWIGATMKKAATKPLEYNVAARSVMNEKQPTFTASKVSIDTKVFEVYNETKGTWSTTVPKVTEDTTFQIRAKATAKGGKESASTFAASDPGELYVEYGIVDEDKDKSGYTNAYILAPAFDGFLRGRPYKGSVSTPEVDA
ncbi:MAG: hypothetical protein LBR85_03610, partial [Oscillospiraceae bacterium]|nr:hypothetical protein [Oscillospiraceae bacterium]